MSYSSAAIFWVVLQNIVLNLNTRFNENIPKEIRWITCQVVKETTRMQTYDFCFSDKKRITHWRWLAWGTVWNGIKITSSFGKWTEDLRPTFTKRRRCCDTEHWNTKIRPRLEFPLLHQLFLPCTMRGGTSSLLRMQSCEPSDSR